MDAREQTDTLFARKKHEGSLCAAALPLMCPRAGTKYFNICVKPNAVSIAAGGVGFIVQRNAANPEKLAAAFSGAPEGIRPPTSCFEV